MKILVTGGAGFIGSNIVDRYISLGHKVVVVDNLSTGKKSNLNPKAKFYKLDISDKKLAGIIKKEKIEVINHHAAQIDLRISVKSPVYDAGINILGSINVFQSAVNTQVKKIIFSSTGGAIYGEQEHFPALETDSPKPLSPYGIAKFSVEKYLFFYKYVYGIDYVVLRYANVYGPRQDSHGEAGVVAIFTEKMLKKQKTVINGAGLQTRDFTYVGDIVEADVLALGYKGTDIFNVGTQVETDVNTLWYKLSALTGYKGKIAHGPAKKGEQDRSVVDTTKIRNALGWTPKHNLDTGLAETVAWFRSRLK